MDLTRSQWTSPWQVETITGKPNHLPITVFKKIGAVLLESCNLVAITETWWYGSHDWSVAIAGYGLFRRDKQGRRGVGVALCIKKLIECEELSLDNSHVQVESLWVRIRDRGNEANLVVGICYRPLINGSLLMEPSYSSSRRHCTCRLLSCWGSSFSLAV